MCLWRCKCKWLGFEVLWNTKGLSEMSRREARAEMGRRVIAILDLLLRLFMVARLREGEEKKI